MRNNFVLRWIVPKKRIGRLAFAERMVAALLVIVACLFVPVLFAEHPQLALIYAPLLISSPKMLLLWLIVFWVFFSWHISRLHDIGKGISGRWLAIILCIFILISLNIDLIYFFQGSAGSGDPYNWRSPEKHYLSWEKFQFFSWIVVFSTSTALPIIIIDLLLLAVPGNTRENRHGPAPDEHDSICIFLFSKLKRTNVEQRQTIKIHSKIRGIYGDSLKTKIVCWALGVLVLLGEIIAIPLVFSTFWISQTRNIDRFFSARSLNRAIVYDVAWAADMWIAVGGDLSSLDNKGITPIHNAAITGNSKIVKKLLEAGADPHIRSQTGKTPMHIAAHYGNAEVIKVLIEAGADPNAQDTDRGTPLHYAATKRDPEVIKVLIEAGGDPNALDTGMDTPLHGAVDYGENLDVIKTLIKFGAHVHIKNRRGKTPLDRAIRSGRIEVIEILYKTGG